MSISRGMDKEDVEHIYNRILLRQKTKQNTKSCHLQGYGWTQKLSYRMKSEREQISYINIYVWNLENGTDEPICKAEIKTQTWRTNIWIPKGKGGEG